MPAVPTQLRPVRRADPDVTPIDTETIRRRAAHVRRYFDEFDVAPDGSPWVPLSVRTLFDHDIPTLLAEVARLNAPTKPGADLAPRSPEPTEIAPSPPVDDAALSLGFVTTSLPAAELAADRDASSSMGWPLRRCE